MDSETRTSQATADAVLRKYGATFAHDCGIRLQDTPAPLFQLLYSSLLMSAPIEAEDAVQASRALVEAGLTTPEKMAEATWQVRVDILANNGYKRFDESTSQRLGEAAEMVIERYDGDLRTLREDGDREVAQQQKLLQEFKGIGELGANIFLREVQTLWDEAYPFADERVLEAAGKLALPQDAGELSKLVSKDDFPKLLAGLMKVKIAKAWDEFSSEA